MPDLSELISLKVFSIAFPIAILMLVLFNKQGVFKSWFDPALLPWFQIIFTCATLAVIGILPNSQLIYFIILVLLVLFTNSIKINRISIVPQSLFESFSYALFFVCILTNTFIISQKGFIFLENDVVDAKLFYYQDYGIFKRINEIAAPILTITSFKFLRQGKRKTPVAFLILATFCLITLGSKAGLLTFIFLYGAYFHFNVKREQTNFKKNRVIFIGVGLILGFSSVVMFYLIYQNYFLQAFFFRFIGYADGPVFFYDQQLYKHISYDPMYMFDQLFYALRIRTQLKYVSLGPLINYYAFGFDNDLFGPNPQIFVESSVLFHQFAGLYYLLAYLLFFLCRKLASTPYTFYFLTGFATTFFIDSQYAFYQIFNLLLLAIMLLFFLFGRSLWVYFRLKLNPR